jgi:tetratricopeptide (TPR) repeat protein
VQAGQYYFLHLLTRDAAYAALLDKNRRLLHSSAAQALEARLAPGTAEEAAQLGTVARHWRGARRWRQAHAQLCRQLKLLAHAGVEVDWEARRAEADCLWQLARQDDPGLPPLSWQRACVKAQREYRAGRVDAARSAFAAGLAAADAQRDLRGRCECLLNGAAMELELGRTDLARSLLDSALEQAAALGDAHTIGVAQGNQGVLLWQTGRLAEAEALLREAATTAGRHGDRRTEGYNLGNLGSVLAARERFAESAACLRQALAIAREIGDRRSAARHLGNLGIIEAAQQATAEAETHLRAAARQAEELDDTLMRCYWLERLAATLLDEGQPAVAREALQVSLPLARELGSQRMLAIQSCLLAMAEQRGGNAPAAQRAWHAAQQAAVHVHGAAEAEVAAALAAVRSELGPE